MSSIKWTPKSRFGASAREGRAAFQQILEAVEDQEAGAPHITARPSNAIPTTLSPSTPLCPEGGVAAIQWSFAYEAVDEPGQSDAPPSTLNSISTSPDSIAAELNLESAKSPADIHWRRRRFMWDNHPDRRSDIPRATANLRVAIANMLIDQAIKRFR